MPKITALPAAAAANTADILAKVNDPSGSPVTQQVTLAQIQSLLFPGGQTWDTIIVKSASQVVNNLSITNDTELFTALAANGLYQVELFLISSGNSTAGDYAGRFGIPLVTAGTSTGYLTQTTAAGTFALTPCANGILQFPSSNFVTLGVGANTRCTATMKFLLKNEANAGTLQYGFGVNVLSVGRTATTWAGSTLKVKRLF